MIRSWLRSPIVHFAVLGAALFGLRALWEPVPPAPKSVARQPIVISAERIRSMQAEFAARWGAMPTPQQLTVLIEQAIEEELLYREARVLALDFGDRSVQRRLIDKMRWVSDRPDRSRQELAGEARALGLDDDVIVRRLLAAKMRLFLERDPAAAITEKDLQSYLEQNPDRFVLPAELSFSHVFLSETTRGKRLEKDAQAILAQLRSRPTGPDAVAELSDPFPLGLHMRAYTRDRITSRFGKSFATQVCDVPPDQWSGPIASPYGLHLVRVDEKSPPRLPQLASVHRQVIQAVRAERAAAQFARGLARLRTLYEIRVEGRAKGSTVTG